MGEYETHGNGQRRVAMFTSTFDALKKCSDSSRFVVTIQVLVVLAIVQFMVKPGQATVRCDQVIECLASCIPYLTPGAGNPTTQCYGSVGRLQKIAETTADKQEACKC
ncbi:Uncharacterized protein TCM_005702 [Theobroma cacao]|uniref:Plant lipid transfer protein/Par allergen n=1 Tax=Theobroma cacao TaxID=3641 RepID=A0A061DWK0_THECC|nr:Uncharacterized protein TCM_005702 [Theobroma cacao]